MSSEHEGRTLNEEANTIQSTELIAIHTGPESPNLPPHHGPYSCVNLKSLGQPEPVHWKTRFARTCRQASSKAFNPAMNVYQDLLTQTDSELRVMHSLLQQTQARKTQMTKALCGYLSPIGPDSVHKPRNKVEVAAPTRITDWVIKSLKESQHAFCMNVRKSTPNISSYRVIPPLTSPSESATKESQSSHYDQELAKLLSESGSLALKNKSELLRQLLHTDLTGYGHNKRGMILFMNFQYDFPVANPLALLAARWNFVMKEQQIVQYVEKRRNKWRKESKVRLGEYKKKYDEWRYKNRKLDLQANGDENELRFLKRVDIYGREAHIVCSPKIPLLSGTAPDGGDFLGNSIASQLRKESLEIDPDLLSGHAEHHNNPYVNYYSKPVTFRTKPGLVKDPLAQASGPEKTLWSKWEIQLFLEQYLIHPKDFVRMAGHFPHKTATQLTQFYFDFKWVFELKKNYWRLIAAKRDRHISLHDLARELAKRLISEKLPSLSEEGRQKALFTIAEIKAMARGQRGKPTQPHKAKVQDWAIQYQTQVTSKQESFKANPEFFYKTFASARSKIQSLFASCALNQTRIEKMEELTKATRINDDLHLLTQKKRVKPELNGEKSRGTHWSPQEKEQFFKWFRVLGKDWKALKTKFPSKTDKQLRNFYQNNKVKLTADSERTGSRTSPLPNDFVHP